MLLSAFSKIYLLFNTPYKNTIFSVGDHRNFNRNGEAFDKGETFSGIDYNTGIDAVEELKRTLPSIPITMLALKWILMFKEVSCIIPGASNAEQVIKNIEASDVRELKKEELDTIENIYNKRIKNLVHHYW